MNRKLRKWGFSLIEAVIASGILVMVAGASLQLALTVIKGNQNLADRTQALYLASEALEVAQNMRDTNYIDENPDTKWSNGFADGSYGVIYNGTRWLLSPAAANQTLTLDPNGTVFQRNVVITATANLGITRENIKATVSWNGGSQKIELATYLEDSRQQ